MKANIEVSAEILVNIRFQMEVEAETTLTDVNKKARGAAERVATGVVGLRGDTASASMQRITSFSTRML